MTKDELTARAKNIGEWKRHLKTADPSIVSAWDAAVDAKNGKKKDTMFTLTLNATCFEVSQTKMLFFALRFIKTNSSPK